MLHYHKSAALLCYGLQSACHRLERLCCRLSGWFWLSGTRHALAASDIEGTRVFALRGRRASGCGRRAFVSNGEGLK